VGIIGYAPGNNVLVFPADLVAESADGAVLAAGAETEDAESLRNNHTLLLVVRGRDTLENLEALESSSTTGGLVGHHSADGLVEDAGRSTEVEGTCKVQYGWSMQTISSYSGIGRVSPPRVGLKRVILRR
jgi:hypothetical protein